MYSIRTILFPTDFSDCSYSARRVAVALARAHDARLVVLHVAPGELVYSGMIGGRAAEGGHLGVLEAQVREAIAHQFDRGTEIRVTEGDAASAILGLANELRADVIVMGTVGRSGLGRLIQGSVAEEVMRKSPCPVLAVKPPGISDDHPEEETPTGPEAASSPFPVILQPTDFSDRARQAFEIACALARGQSKIIVLHVVEAVHVGSEGYADALEERLGDFRPGDPRTRVEHRLREGDPAEEILRVAEEDRCDLIVMGTHDRSGLDRLVSGSVAESVLRRAGCPVLAVKVPPPPADDARPSSRPGRELGAATG